MILWTIQPLDIYNLIIEKGVYRCNPELIQLKEFTEYYDWLVNQMTDRIGKPPAGVTYPVWAWYIRHWKRGKPDLRKERWNWGPGNEEYACLEIEIPDEDVVLFDFDAWIIILNNGLLSDTEEEDKQQEVIFISLSESEQEKYRLANWQRAYDISPHDSDWITRGESVQATFWELKKEQIKKVQIFHTVSRKDDMNREEKKAVTI